MKKRSSASRNAADVVLVDIDMPVTDGVETTKQITARFPAARVIILSGLYAPERVDQARRFGAEGFLPKDRISDDLIALVLMRESSLALGASV